LASFLERNREGDMADKNVSTGFVTGFVMGVLVGLAIGFLYAPQAGEETRQRFGEEVKRIKEQTAEIAGKVEKSAAEMMKKVEAKVEEAEEQAKK